jgi:hypothetical protein
MSALATHTFGKQREKETEKKQIERNFNKLSNAEKGKEQDHLKKTSLGPLRQGQRLDTSETKPCSSKEHKPPKHTRAPPEQVQTWAQTGQAGSQNRSDRFHQNRSDRFPKPVRPISHSRPHPQKPKMKEMHKLPLDTWNRFQRCNATFLHLPFSPLLPIHESRLKFEKMQPRASPVYKIHHKMLHMSK